MVQFERENDFVGRRHEGWNRPSPIRKKRKKRPFLIFTLVILLGFGILYSYIFLLPALNQGPDVEKTKDLIAEVIDAHPDYDIGVSIVDVDTQKRIDIGNQSSFTAASTTKLLTAALTMHEIENGKLKLDTEINDSPVSWHLEQMVNQSNNESWKALNHTFGKSKMERYAKSIGLSSYRYEGNTISPQDMGTLLAKLYGNKLMNKDHTGILLGHMVHTNEDSFIPAIADTEDIKVYHKYGWLDSNIHDVAILSTEKDAWALAIYTNPKDNGNNSTTSREIIHQITQIVVDQFSPSP